MINWFNMPAEGLSNGGQFEIKELTATENRTYEKDGEVYNKVTVNVSGGGSSDFSTAEVTIQITSQQPNAQILIPTIISSSIEAIMNTPYNYIAVSTPHTITVPLYKGSLIVNGDWSSGDVTVNVSGSVEVMENSFLIKGDCTITIS